MPFRLEENVRVRQESWGLLFYSPARHKVCFVRSGDWLHPENFTNTWTPESLAGDISRRTGVPAEIIERSLPAMTERLLAGRMVTDEVR